MPPRDPATEGLSRQAVVAAALAVIAEVGVDGLSMRLLADRLGVKAASLYWHVRDKEQLLDALAASLLDAMTVDADASWRHGAEQAAKRLGAVLAEHPGAADLLLRSPGRVVRSSSVQALAALFRDAGIAGAEAAAVSVVLEVAAATAMTTARPLRPDVAGALALHIESGAWRVHVRAGNPAMAEVASSSGGQPEVEARADGTVLVRSWRGGFQRGAVELNPAYAWSVHLHSGAWNAMLDLAGLRVTGVDLDSGTGNITCVLPMPSGRVPIRVNSGIVSATLHRPRRAAARAVIHSGSLRVKFDDRSLRVSSADVEWATPGADAAPDRFDVVVHSGCVKVTMDASAPDTPVPAPRQPGTTAESGDIEGLTLLLDGIEWQLRAGAADA